MDLTIATNGSIDYKPFPPIRRFPFCVFNHLVPGYIVRRSSYFKANIHDPEKNKLQFQLFNFLRKSFTELTVKVQ